MWSLFIRVEITLNKLSVKFMIVGKQKLGILLNEYRGKY
jgi:hypothetical protein